MKLRIFDTAWSQWISKLATHPVVPVAVALALTALAVWALVASESKLIQSPHTPPVFSPK